MTAATYLVNSLWQVPLVFIAAWAAARLARQAGPRMEHRVWVIALLLETVLPFCRIRLDDLSALWQQAYSMVLSWFGSATPNGQTRVTLGPAIVPAGHMLRLPSTALEAITAAYALGLLYFAARLLWALWKTETMRRQATHATLTDEIAQKLNRCGNLFRIPAGSVEVAISPMIPGPVTVGIRHSTLLLPPNFLRNIHAGDLDAVLAHEFAHLRRHDFAKNLLYGLASLPIAWHPLVWLTRSRIAETREIVCDAIAAEAVQGRDNYARSLLRLASMLSNRTPATTLHAIGIFDANVFERRIMNLTRKHFEISGLGRLVIATACGVIALATCTSALAFRVDAGAQSKQPQKLHVSADAMQGNILYKVAPVYPEEAKKQKIEGKVVISLDINKEGVPENLQVTESPDNQLSQSATEAVNQWRWKPYLLNGNPVEVETTVNVIYSLAK